MTSAPLDTDRLVGDRYVLETLIAKGGMGEVWRARHRTLKSLVAIKFLHRASLFSQSTRKRFLTEAQVTANLKTRHAVQVFDFGVTDDELPYLVMEYLEGETLEKRLAREGSLSIEMTVLLLRQAARALYRAHALGIVHRDFKPENIVILADEEGGEHVKVVDFGIAKILGDLAEVGPPSSSAAALAGITSSGTNGGLGHVTNTAVGTPYYMAPEQVQDSSKVGPAADIWAFGVVAYECLTGRRPYDDVSIPMLLARIVTCQRPEAASTFAPVPVAFDDWFDIACAHDPEDRFPDAQTAVMALSTALEMPGAAAVISRTSVVGPAPMLKRVVSPLAATLDARKSARPPKIPSGAHEGASPESQRPASSQRTPLPGVPLPGLLPQWAPLVAVLPPPPLTPKVQTYAPIEPASRPSRALRGPRIPLGVVLIGGSIALAATLIAFTRPTTSALPPSGLTTAALVASPASAATLETASPPPPSAASTASPPPSASAAPPSAPTVIYRTPAPKKTAAPARSAPPVYQLPPLGL